MPSYYSPVASMHHYLHMARGNQREYLRGETVWVKKYFYVLRPLLAIRWLEQQRGPVPMSFTDLFATVDDDALLAAIEKLRQRKIAGEELDRGPAIPERSTPSSKPSSGGSTRCSRSATATEAVARGPGRVVPKDT